MARKKRLPDTIYKYYGPERLEVFRTFLVRFSQLGALNDPFEFRIGAKPGDMRRGADRMARQTTNAFSMVGIAVSGTIKAVDENPQLKSASWWLRVLVLSIIVPFAVVLALLLGPFVGKHLRKFLLAAAADVEILMFRQVREGLVLIFSCSETWSSVPMWAHYAANHTGFALGLDPSASFADPRPKAKSSFIEPRKVRYLKREPRMNPSTLDLGDFITAKMDHWAYEREWRFIGMPDDAAERGSFVSGHELLLYRLEPSSIREVIFGANCRAETVAEVMEMLARTEVSSTYYQIRRSTGYGFERVRITHASDLQVETLPAGQVPNLRDQDFQNFTGAFGEFRKDAEQSKLTRWLLNLGDRK